MKKYKIAYLSHNNPEDKKSNSGIQYYMLSALKFQGNEVDVFYPSGLFSRTAIKVLYRLYCFIHPECDHFSDWPIYMRFLGYYFSLRLTCTLKKHDCLFTSRGSHLIAYLKYKLPLIYTSDITYQLMLDYYKGYDQIPKIFFDAGHFKEAKTITRAALCFYPSEWAAASAIRDYGADPERVVAIPSGANFDKESIPDLKYLIEGRADKSIWRVLFIGRDWAVKGGDIAFNAVRLLNEKGIHTTLTVIGCLPTFKAYPDWLTVIERLDKNIPEQNQKMVGYFSSSHVFLLPTRHEAFGLVFAEACAYGLPCLGTDTGGVSMSVKHNKNGFLFNIDDGAEVYAAKLLELWGNDILYSQFTYYGRDYYENVLNWNAWGITLQKELVRVVH